MPCALITLTSTPAFAGGFELPDLGSQALGRGAAFVAKADDPTAIYYNPAGLARQRGTHLLVNGNLYLHSFTFQRAGRYRDDPSNSATPWGGQSYAPSSNVGNPNVAPFVALTTDFGTFDRLTAAIGLYTPSSVTGRAFRAVIDHNPASSRYDFMQAAGTYLYPTASVGYRVTPWLDLGASVSLAFASFGTQWKTYADDGQCANSEYVPCDSKTTVDASATTIAATFGAMVRPTKNWGFGLTFHTPTTFNASGTLTAENPKGMGMGDVTKTPILLTSSLPWTARLGARYIAMKGTFEEYDLEINAVYEAWKSAQGDGITIDSGNVPFGNYQPLKMLLAHGYNDTMGVRLGGAYNFALGNNLLSLRGGAFYDSSATDFAHTRVDYDTLAKIAGTFGLGYKTGAFSLDVAYAAVASMSRLVATGGGIRPLNPTRSGQTIGGSGSPLDPINQGAYRGFTHIVSLGVGISFDEAFGFARPSHYGNSYEHGYVPGKEPPPSKVKEDREDKEEEKEHAPSDDGGSPPPEDKPSKPKHNPDDPWS